MKLGKTFWTGGRSLRRLLVESAHGRLGVLICSEILEAAALSELSGRVELLVVPAWNQDTPSFEYIVHAAASMLVHSFVCVANDATSSDSRIAAPVKEPRHERDWCRLVHRGATQVIWGDLPIDELRRVHEGGPSNGFMSVATGREYRPLPPDWNGA
jgi:predicted amidohydrolase